MQAAPAKAAGNVEATRARRTHCGVPPSVAEGSCCALVGYCPFATAPGKVSPFPLFMINREEQLQVVTEQLLQWGEGWDMGGVSASPFPLGTDLLSLVGATLAYDENGNLATRTDACGTTNYTWDARNRLTGISGYKPDCSALTASFSYDALNRRTSKTINGTTTSYVYDGWDIVKETTGGVTTNYTRTLNIDEPLAFERSDGTVGRFNLQVHHRRPC